MNKTNSSKAIEVGTKVRSWLGQIGVVENNVSAPGMKQYTVRNLRGNLEYYTRNQISEVSN